LTWLNEGLYVDAKDSVNNWCVAQVVEVDAIQDRVKVHYDGWSQKWETWIPVNSDKLAPFRMHSKRYSGQTKQAIRDWALKLSEIEEIEKLMTSLVQSEFALPAPEITQFLRGRLFIFVDNIMTFNYTLKQDFIRSVKFLVHVIEFLINWLQRLPPLLRKLNFAPATAFLTDTEIALASAWPELNFTLSRLFGDDARCAAFLKVTNYIPSSYIPSDCTELQHGNWSRVLLFFINYFAKLGGFQIVQSLFEIKDEETRPSLEFLQSLPVFGLMNCFSRPFAQVFVPKLKECVSWRLQNLNQKEIKEFNKEVIEMLLVSLAVIGKYLDSRGNPYENVEILELQIAMKLITCPFLEKRVKGINELNEIINKVKARAVNSLTQVQSKWLTSSILVEWLEVNNVVATLFSENSHLEIIKRSSDVLAFIGGCNKLTERHLDLIWSGSQAKHESQAKQTYTLLIELLKKLSISQCGHLFRRMQEVPLHKYDEKFLKLIKDFTLVAFSQLQTARKPFNPYGIPLLQQAMMDNSPVSCFDLASELLSELVSNPFAEEVSEKLLNKCALLLQEGDSVVQCLTIMTAIISSSRASRFSFADPIKQRITELDQKLGGIIPFVLENVAAYISAAKSRSFMPCDLQNLIIQGRYIHKVAVQRRFAFLDFIVLNSKQAVSFSSGDICLLWALFIENSPSQEDSDVFYRWLYEPRGMTYPFSKETIIEIFSSYLAIPEKHPFTTLSVEGFNCFWKYFILVNLLRGTVEVRDFRLTQRISPILEGYDALKEIVVQSDDSKVTQAAIGAVVSLHIKVARASLVETWQRLIDECLDLIERRMNDFKAVSRILELLSTFIDDRPPVEDDSEKTCQIYVKLSSYFEYHRLWIDLTKPLAYLRHQLAQTYKMPAKEVRMTINGIRYNWLDDDLPLNSIRELNIVIVDRASPTEATPKDVAAQSQRVLDTLFQLLSVPKASYSELAWNLLSSLPTSLKIKNSFTKLDRQISGYLDTSSPHKLLYCLTILSDLAKNDAWNSNFVAVGGLDTLMNVFLETDFTEVELSFKYHSLMLGLLRRLVNQREIAQDLQKFLQRVLCSLLAIANCCTQKAFGEETKIAVQSAHFLIKACLKRDSETGIQHLLQSKQLKNAIKYALLYSKSPEFSLAFSEVMHALPIKERLNDILVKSLRIALESKYAIDSYFSTLSDCIAEVKLSDRKLKSIATKLITSLKERPSEKNSKDRDVVMHGALKVLHTVLDVVELDEYQDFLHFILHNCLFEVPLKATVDRPPKCKNFHTRHEAFLVLYSLCSKPQNLELVLNYLSQFHQDPHWRTYKTMDWQYSPASLEKSETGFVGLKNLGATCYMSSTLQNLFMMPSFRAGIMDAPPNDPLLKQLQHLLASLQHSDRQYINPKDLCAAYTDWEGNSVNVGEQKDVFEFAITFMDKLEGMLKGTQQANLINQHFGGLQANELIGKGTCCHRSERDEALVILPLEIKDKKSIIDSLNSFVEGEPLEGENAYQCDHCEAKVSALKRSCIRHLPNVLILALRRFEFNYDTMQRVKLNDYCEFPMDLNMKPYTLEGLEEEHEDAVPKHPESYYNYKLKGVLIHTGTADSGHYYTYIQDRQSKAWIEFNDTLVREFDPKELATEAFGGEEKLSYKNFGGQEVSANREKYRNAYMLFYERETLYKPRTNGDDPLEELESPPAQVGDYSELVKVDNLRYWRCRNSFSPEYFEFVYRLSRSGQPQIFKFIMEFFLTILIRSKDRSKLTEFYRYIYQEISQSKDNKEWLLEVFTVPQITKELFLDCPILEVRRLLVGLFKASLIGVDESIVFNSAARLLTNLPRARKPFSRYFAQYFNILACIVLSSPSLIQDLKLAQRLLCHLLNDPAKFEEIPFTYKNSDIWLGYDNFTAKENSEELFASSEKGSHFSYLLHALEASASQFSTEEIEVLKRPNIIKAIAIEGFTKIGARAVSRLYLSLSQDDLQLSKTYLGVVVELIGERDFDFVKIYFRLLNQYLKVRCSLQELRVDFCLTELNEVMKQNRQYYKFTEACLEALLRMATRIHCVRFWFTDNSKEFRWLEVWLQENLYPPSGVQGSRTVMYKSSQWSAVTPANPKSNADKVDFLKRLFKGTLGDRSTDWDSDDDFSQQEVRVKQRFDILDHTLTQWVRAEVVVSMGELLMMNYESNGERLTKWEDLESEYMYPEGYKSLR